MEETNKINTDELMHEISKTFTFDAAHRLYKMKAGHPCKNIHGHTYNATLTLKLPASNKDEFGMVLDYHNFEFFKKIISVFDHTVLVAQDDSALINACKELNSIYIVLPIEQTTCECICEYLMHLVKTSVTLRSLKDVEIEIELSETPKTRAKVYFKK